MTVLEECILNLGKNVKVLSQYKSKKLFAQFEKNVPLLHISGSILSRVNWKLIKNKVEILDYDILLKNKYINSNNSIFVLWNEYGLPVIETILINVLNNLEDVTAVGFDTWLYCPEDHYVIEFHHSGDITLGFF